MVELGLPHFDYLRLGLSHAKPFGRSPRGLSLIWHALYLFWGP